MRYADKIDKIDRIDKIDKIDAHIGQNSYRFVSLSDFVL